MTKEINKQIKLLKKYGVNNYIIENGRIVINQNIRLDSLTTDAYTKNFDKGFLNETTINGWLSLNSFTTVPENFLEGATINGSLYLHSLTTAPENFLEGTTINGSLYLRSLTTVPENFLEGTTINGTLYLRSLTTAPENFFEGATINGNLWLDSLTIVPKNFLSKIIVDGWVIRKNVRKYGFLSRNKNTNKIARFLNGNSLEGEGVEIRQDKTL